MGKENIRSSRVLWNRIKNGEILAIVLFIIMLAGCSAIIRSSVNSITDPQINTVQPPYNEYVMLPLMQDVDPATDLQYREYESIVDRALKAQGFVKAQRPEDAGVVVFIIYGIGDPTKQMLSYNMPVYGQTGVSSSSTTGTVSLRGNRATLNSTTTYMPSYGITGYVPVNESYTEYTRYLFLEAIDAGRFKVDQKIIPVWQTSVISTGSTGDLRTIFPYLVKAAAAYFGKNTGKGKTITLSMK